MVTKFIIQQEPGFYLDRDRATMPKCQGIYVVYRCDYNSYYDTVDVKEVLYIGESLNIHEHHNGTPDYPRRHELYEEFVDKAGGSEHVCYGVIPMNEFSDEERKWIQVAMIFCQKPPINGEGKENYTHSAADIEIKGLPGCWRSFHISLPLNK